MWRNQSERLKTDIGFARHKFASRNVKKYLDHATRAISKKDARAFYDALSKGLQQYLADKLNQPAGTIQIGEICGQLLEKGAKQETTEKLKTIDGHCHMALFASASSDAGQMTQDLNEARKILDQLEKVL